ncbi:MAG: hypothetical protein ACI9O6_000899 [Glaciecola sp.]|jgi:hypothetical protein
MRLSKHAELRMQQRAISWEHIETVLAFGEDYYHGENGYYTCLSNRTIRRLSAKATVLSSTQILSKLKRLFVVSAENTIVTVGYKTKHIHNH